MIGEHPDLAKYIHGFAPNAFRDAIIDCDGGRTVSQLANECRVSAATIRRVAKSIQARPRFSWYHTVVYAADQVAKIRTAAPRPKQRKRF